MNGRAKLSDNGGRNKSFAVGRVKYIYNLFGEIHFAIWRDIMCARKGK